MSSIGILPRGVGGNIRIEKILFIIELFYRDWSDPFIVVFGKHFKTKTTQTFNYNRFSASLQPEVSLIISLYHSLV